MLRRFHRRSFLSTARRAGRRAEGARQAGFSLPEILVVVSIILLLATMVVPRGRRAKEKAQEAAAAQNLRNIHTSQEAHRVLTGSYAPTFQALQSAGGGTGLPPDAETGPGSSGEDVMVHDGYIFRLTRTAADQYQVSAEPVIDRDARPRYAMNQSGSIMGLTASGGDTPPPEIGAKPPPPEPPPPEPPPPQ